MPEEKEPIRRWSFEMVASSGSVKAIKVTIFGTAADADKTCAYIMSQYKGPAPNPVTVRPIPNEEVTEETKAAYDLMVDEAGAAIQGMGYIFDVVYREDTQEEKDRALLRSCG